MRKWIKVGIAAAGLLIVASVTTGYIARHDESGGRGCEPALQASNRSSSGSNVGTEASPQALQESLDQLVPPPTGSTGNATAITDTAATLHGSVAPNGEDTKTYFQYGLTASYGARTPATDAGSQASSATSARVSHLVPNTTYHYLETIETEHHLLAGADQCFTTAHNHFAPAKSTPIPPATPAHEGPSQ